MLRICLGDCPDDMEVEVHPGVPLAAKTVADLRALNAWSPYWVLIVLMNASVLKASSQLSLVMMSGRIQSPVSVRRMRRSCWRRPRTSHRRRPRTPLLHRSPQNRKSLKRNWRSGSVCWQSSLVPRARVGGANTVNAVI